MKLLTVLVLAVIAATPILAQESALGAAFRHEGEEFHDNCITFSIIGCGQTLVTGNPLHIAVGGLAPKNGTGLGLAFVTHYTPNERWRLFFNADAVATSNQSWRAGAYLSAVLIRRQPIKVVTGTAPRTPSLAIHEMPVFHAYAQGTSLNTVDLYLVNPLSGDDHLSTFGLTQTVVGGNVIWPLFDPLKVSLFGEANGRFFSLHTGSVFSGPQPSFGQFAQGIQMHPTLALGYIRLDYTAGYEEWAAPGATASFQRFKADLSNRFSLYRNAPTHLPRAFNGPDSCAEDANSLKCPSVTRNLEGSLELRFIYTASYTSGGNTIPFYLEPTIGGTDINGMTLLPSLPDYRYRAPDFMVFRFAFEHSIYKWPIGVKVMLDEGKVGARAGDLSFDHFLHSYAAGFTLHAGGFPVVDLLFAWGGGQGSRTIATVSPSLSGGSSRPPLD